MSKDSKDSFVFYRDWYYAATSCDEQTQLKLYRAIMEYVFLDIEPNDPAIQLAFGIIKQRLDADRDRYDEKCEKNKEIARKRWEAYHSKRKNTNECERIRTHTNDTDNENVNDNENGYQDTSVSMDTKEFKPTDESVGTLQSHDSNPPQVRYEGLVKYWNELVADKAISKITDIKEGTTRRKLVAARIKEYGKDKFAKCLRKAASSPFLNGDNAKSFIATFDWIIRPNNFPKVLEGNYDIINNGTNRTNNNTKEQRLSAVADRVSQLLAEDGNS